MKEILCAVFILDEPSAFYAEELFEATEGLGTNDEKLQRIFVLRAEVVEWIFNFEISSGGLEKHRPCVQEPVWEAPGQVGEGGDGGPLQEHLARPPSPWQNSMSLRSSEIFAITDYEANSQEKHKIGTRCLQHLNSTTFYILYFDHE